ncbi:hypothetical protein ACIBAC_00720 [Streptomyces sp. NPDC051362]|uniref:hypothetical protein n=1 Tax=Streptomyces sp. NPDC051362 TaxID=3365651 RepID=UPI0037B4ED87
MSTPTPAPQPATAEETPFDPYAYPPNLVKAQLRAATLYAELHRLQKALPWSREPHEGWPAVEERGRERSGRDASPGWGAETAAAYEKARAELLEAAAYVHTHDWWKTCRDHGVQGGKLVDVRQALKHADGAVPLVREDVDVAA